MPRQFNLLRGEGQRGYGSTFGPGACIDGCILILKIKNVILTPKVCDSKFEMSVLLDARSATNLALCTIG